METKKTNLQVLVGAALEALELEEGAEVAPLNSHLKLQIHLRFAVEAAIWEAVAGEDQVVLALKERNLAECR